MSSLSRIVLFAFLLFTCTGELAKRPRGASLQNGGGERHKTIWDGVYSTAQANRGLDSYMDRCVGCHGEDLSGDTPYNASPSLAGKSFMLRWDNRTVDDLFDFVRSRMPKTEPGSLTDKVYVDILSFILQYNKVPSGKEEMTTDREALKKILITKDNASAN